MKKGAVEIDQGYSVANKVAKRNPPQAQQVANKC